MSKHEWHPLRNLRIPAPIEGVALKVKYREVHVGLPFWMRIFMGACRAVVYLLTAIGCVAAEFWLGKNYPPGAIAVGLAFAVLYFIYTALGGSGVDFYTPIGYYFFHRMIEVKS